MSRPTQPHPVNPGRPRPLPAPRPQPPRPTRFTFRLALTLIAAGVLLLLEHSTNYTHGWVFGLFAMPLGVSFPGSVPAVSRCGTG